MNARVGFVVTTLLLTGCGPLDDGDRAEVAQTSQALTSVKKVLCHQRAAICARIPNLVPGTEVVFWSADQWRAATVEDFLQFAMIYIHDSAGSLPEIASAKAKYAQAVNGRVAITGLHFEHCTASLAGGPCTALRAMSAWVTQGAGTGLLASTQAVNSSWLPASAPYNGVVYAGVGGGYDRVRILEPGHAVMQGSTEASLSNFFNSSHNYFSAVGAFTSVAEVCKTAGITYPSPCGNYAPYVLVTSVGVRDQDGDGISDEADNCPTVSNPSQQDGNGNGTGDACESAPTVRIAPRTIDVVAGTSVTFTADAADSDHGVATLRYEWRRDGIIQSATGRTFTATFSAASVVRVTVRDPGGLTGFDEAQVRIGGQNRSPLADAGADQLFTCLAPGETASVLLDGSGSSDPDGDALSYQWSEGGSSLASGQLASVSLGIARHTVELAVADGKGGTAVDTAVIDVQQDWTPPTLTLLPAPPTLQCGVDRYVEAGATATDGCDGDLTARVRVDGTVDEASPGSYAVDYEVQDDAGNAVHAHRAVQVVDTLAPVASLRFVPEIWPPNHRYVTFDVADCVASIVDQCGGSLDVASSARFVSVSSSEPDDAAGGGDGHTTDDAVLLSERTVQVRAERAGGGAGRVYTADLEVTDAAGNTVFASCELFVPHSRAQRL